jgi:rSAM/selenodomain-associated transferase 1
MSAATVENRVIVYVRRPWPGRCKTRLASSIGWDEAAGVYARLVYGYLDRLIRAEMDVAIEIATASKLDTPFYAAAFPECIVRPQREGELGARMWSSFQATFREGAQRVVLTGSDIPDLSPRHIRQALSELDDASIVLGPASDGGYYLVAMRSPGEDIFGAIAWSSPQVLAQTLESAGRLGRKVALIEELDDLDNRSDYTRWHGQWIASTR